MLGYNTPFSVVKFNIAKDDDLFSNVKSLIFDLYLEILERKPEVNLGEFLLLSFHGKHGRMQHLLRQGRRVAKASQGLIPPPFFITFQYVYEL